MSLNDSLTHFYKMEETGVTDDRVDQQGNGNLTANTTVASTTGKFGNAIDLVQSHFMIGADATVMQPSGGSFGIMMWVWFDGAGHSQAYLASTFGTAGKNVYQLDHLGTASPSTPPDRYRFLIRNPADSASSSAEINATPDTNTWILVAATWDSVTQTVKLSVNGSTWTETAAGHDMHNPGTPNIVGVGKRIIDSTAFDGGAFNGRIDHVGFWSRLLTQDDVSDFYNGGSGLDFPFPTAEAGSQDGSLRAGGTARMWTPPFLTLP